MSLFKRKETTFEDMDSQEKLKKIMDQLGFLEKKLDSVLESLGNRGGRNFGQGNRDNRGNGFGGNRDNRGGNDRGGFRGGNRDRGRHQSGNTRYAGQGPQRYSPSRDGGRDENRGGFGGGNRHDRGNRHHQGGRRHQGQEVNGNVDPNASTRRDVPAPDESQPE